MSDVYKATKNKIVINTESNSDVYKATKYKQVNPVISTENETKEKLKNIAVESAPFPLGVLTPSTLNNRTNQRLRHQTHLKREQITTDEKLLQSAKANISNGRPLNVLQRNIVQKYGINAIVGENIQEKMDFLARDNPKYNLYQTEFMKLADKKKNGEILSVEENDMFETTILINKLRGEMGRNISTLSSVPNINAQNQAFLQATQIYNDAVNSNSFVSKFGGNPQSRVSIPQFANDILQNIDRTELYITTGMGGYLSDTADFYNTIFGYISGNSEKIKKEIEERPTNPYDLASYSLKQYYKNNGEVVNEIFQDVVTNISRNAIPMALSLFGGSTAQSSVLKKGKTLLEAKNISNRVSRIISTSTFAPSVFGNAYNEGVKNGIKEDWRLLTYASAVTSAECGLELLLGGELPGTGVVSGKVVSNFSKNFGSALGKSAFKLLGNGAGEYVEEKIQSLLGPLLKEWLLGTDEVTVFEDPINALSTSAYEGFIGFVSALIMGGPSNIQEARSEAAIQSNGKIYNSIAKQTGTDIKDIAQFFKEVYKDKTLVKAADKVIKGDMSDITVGELISLANEYSKESSKVFSARIGQNISKIENGVSMILSTYQEVVEKGAIYPETVTSLYEKVKTNFENGDIDNVTLGEFAYYAEAYSPRAHILGEVIKRAQNEQNNNSQRVTLTEAETQLLNTPDSKLTAEQKAEKQSIAERLQTVENNDIINNKISNEPKFLPEEKKAAILDYKSGTAYRINAMLREGVELNESQQQFVDTLDEALRELSTYEGEVYRNLTFDDFGGREAFEAFLEQHMPGMFIVYDQFVSCSTKIDGYPVKGNYKVQMVIDSKNARDVDGYGNNMESEAIFPLKSVFIVKEVDSNGNYPIIHLQEVIENGYYSIEEQSNAVRNLQESHSVHDKVQGISKRDTVGNNVRSIRPQSSPSERQRNNVRTERGQDTLLSAKFEKSVEQKADFTESANFMPESENDNGISGQTDGTELDSNIEVLRVTQNNKQRRHTTAKEQDFIKRVAKALGVKLKFEHITAELLRSYGYDFEDGYILPDGYYDKETKTIHLGYTVYNPLTFVFKHELTHFGEGTKAYGKFTKAIEKSGAFKEWLKQKTGEETDSLGALKGAYRESISGGRKGDFALEGISEVDAEMFANFVGDCLFTEDTSMLENMLSDLNYEERNAVIQYILDFISYLKKKLAGNKEILFEISRLEDNFKRVLSEAVQTKKETPTESGGDLQFSIVEGFKDNEGKQYNGAVLLDTEFFDGLSPRNWGGKLKEYVYSRSENSPFIMDITDEKGNVQRLRFADPKDRVSKNGASNHKVLDKLISTSDNISKLAVLHIDEIVEISKENNPYYTNENNHQWLDKNGWLHRKANVINQKNGNIYNIVFDIAKSDDGRIILYATNGNIKKVGNVQVSSLKIKGSGLNSNFDSSVSQNLPTVNSNSMKENKNNSKNKLKFSFASVQDKSLIAKAEKMETKLISEGKGSDITRMRIWNKYGIVRDGSRQWVYEIPDRKMKFFPLGDAITTNPKIYELQELERLKRLTKEKKARLDELHSKYGYLVFRSGKLKDFINHEELFKKFPQLKEVNFKVGNLPGSALGQYDKSTNTITVDAKLLLEAQKKSKVSGTTSFHDLTKDPFFEVKKTIIHEIQHVLQEEEGRESGASLEYWIRRFTRDNISPEDYGTDMETLAGDAYWRTKGEVEARVASERLNMTEEERRVKMPWFYWEETLSAKEPAGARSLKFSIPSDDSYMSAVESGDTQLLQEMVDNSAATKGYTERLFHQTGAEFTEFNTENQAAGKFDWQLPTGMFLKPSDEDIGLKGKKQMELFVKMENPLRFKNRSEAQEFWSERIPGYKETVETVEKIDNEYRAKDNDAIMELQSYMRQWKKENPDADKRNIYSDLKYQRLADVESNIMEEWEQKSDESSVKAKKLINDFIANSDYDGIVIERDNDGKNHYTKSYIVFDSSQLKSAAPVTYDNNGDVIPLSKRFNQDKKDIRFSISSPMEQTRKNLERYENGEITREEYLEENDRLWGVANETFGMIEQGENARAPIATPRAVAEDKPVERFTRTIIETGKLTEEMLRGMEEKVLLGDFSYEVISDEKATQKAEAAISNGTAEEIWENTVNDKKVNKNQIAIGERLLADAIKNGDTKRVLELSAELADIFTRAGQVVQAARLLKKMSGVGRLVATQRMVKTINKDLRIKHGDDIPPVKINPNLAKQLAEAKTEKDIETVYEDVLQDVASQMPVTFLDKWNAWRYFAMLSNPKTHIRNVVGNAIFTPAVRIKDFIATVGEFGVDQSKRSKAVVIKKEYRDFAKKDSQDAGVKNLLKGNKYNDKSALREKQRIFKSNMLEFLTRFNSNALEAEDMLFKNKHYIHALAGFLQARGVNLNNVSQEVLDEARIYAVEEAKKATFTDESALANWIQNFGNKNLATNIAVEGVLPFKRTPINIVKRGIEYSPIGFSKTLTKGLYDVKKGKITLTEYIDGLASGLTGTGIMLVGMFLANLGCVTGGEEDDEKSQFEKLLGRQEYAVEVFGKSYTIDWAAPANIPFFIGVEIVNTVNQGEEFSLSKVGNAVWNSLEPITNLSMLSGMQGVIESARYAEPSQTLAAIAGDALTSYAMQPIPSLAGAVSRTIDPKQRSWYTDKNSKLLDSTAQAVKNNIQSKVPGLSYTQIPKIDMWGREVTRGSVGERVLENFISPGYYSEIEYTETSEELKRIFNETDVDVFPNIAAKSFEINGKTKHLTADEYVTYAKAKGGFSFDYVKEFMEHTSYERLTDEEKADVIDGLYKYSNAKAKTTVSDYDLMKQYKTVTNWEKNGNSAVDYYISRAINK